MLKSLGTPETNREKSNKPNKNFFLFLSFFFFQYSGSRSSNGGVLNTGTVAVVKS